MQRKQQVGECWVCVIFFACLCVWVRQIRQLHLTIPSPRSLPCALGAFLGGSQGGGGRYAPLWLRTVFGATPPGRDWDSFFFFWAVFAIFSGFVN
jgi:hypothetical protein